MLEQRLISAAILITIVIVGIMLAPMAIFALLMAIFVCIGLWEWSQLVGYPRIYQQLVYLILAICLLGAGYYFHTIDFAMGMIFVALIWWLYALVAIIAYQNGKEIIPSPRILKAGIGLLVLIPAWLSLIIMRAAPDGSVHVLFLFVLIGVADTAAYFIGRRLGKRHLISRVSPSKTWEGVYGALFATIFLALAYAMIIRQWNEIIGIVLLCIITVMFSIIGDLLVSVFKRIMGSKDTGHLIPANTSVSNPSFLISDCSFSAATASAITAYPGFHSRHCCNRRSTFPFAVNATILN